MDKHYISLEKEKGDTVSEVVRKKRNIYSKDKNSSWYYLGVVGQIGFTIAIPIAGGALLGSYLDQRFLSYPKATLILLFLGIVVSMVNFVMTIQAIIRKKI